MFIDRILRVLFAISQVFYNLCIKVEHMMIEDLMAFLSLSCYKTTKYIIFTYVHQHKLVPSTGLDDIFYEHSY